MKKLLAILLCVTMVGCTSVTNFGPCIGAFDEGDPKIIYKVNGWNIFMALFFVQTLFVPYIVIVDETKCPVGKKG